MTIQQYSAKTNPFCMAINNCAFTGSFIIYTIFILTKWSVSFRGFMHHHCTECGFRILIEACTCLVRSLSNSSNLIAQRVDFKCLLVPEFEPCKIAHSFFIDVLIFASSSLSTLISSVNRLISRSHAHIQCVDLCTLIAHRVNFKCLSTHLQESCPKSCFCLTSLEIIRSDALNCDEMRLVVKSEDVHS